jgi:phospholipid/cholesterol/gamma-HCH transport system substrate-binding protein
MIIKSLQDISEIATDLRDPEGPLYTSLDSLAKTLVHIEEVIQEIKGGTSSVDGLIQSEGLIERIYDELNNVNRILGNLEDATAKTPDLMNEVKKSMDMINQILTNIEKGSHDVPAVTKTTKHGIREIRRGVEEVDKVVQSVQKSFLIKPNLPPEPKGEDIDTGLRR